MGYIGDILGYTLLTNPVPMLSTSPTPVVGTNELLRMWMPLHGAARIFPAASFCSCFRYFTKKPWHLLLLNYPKVIHSQAFEIEPLTTQFCLAYFDETTTFFHGSKLRESTFSKSGLNNLQIQHRQGDP